MRGLSGKVRAEEAYEMKVEEKARGGAKGIRKDRSRECRIRACLSVAREIGAGTREYHAEKRREEPTGDGRLTHHHLSLHSLLVPFVRQQRENRSKALVRRSQLAAATVPPSRDSDLRDNIPFKVAPRGLHLRRLRTRELVRRLSRR